MKSQYYVIGTGAYNIDYYYIDLNDYDTKNKSGDCFLLYKSPERLPKSKTGKDSLGLHTVRTRHYQLPMSS
tara:strand:- start:1195 stop:1407 length:213 start_codon:yes stop_codon:yes gene_type:complete